MDRTGRVTLALTAPEALVFFDYLSRANDAPGKAIELHPAEQAVLWDLQASLEKELVAPLQANYAEMVEDARNQVMDSH